MHEYIRIHAFFCNFNKVFTTLSVLHCYIAVIFLRYYVIKLHIVVVTTFLFTKSEKQNER